MIGIDAVINATEGESVSFTIAAADNIGVDEIYFAFYDSDTDDWIVELLEWINIPTVSYTLVMGSESLLYAFIIFDVPGNYVAAGLDTPLEVNLPDMSSPTSSSDITSITTATTTSITPSQTTPSTTNETPLGMISIILELMVMPIIIRRRYKQLV